MAERKRQRQPTRHAWFTLTASALLSASAYAQETIAFRVVGNLMVAECTLQSPSTGIPSFLLIDLGSTGALQLHTKTAEALEITSGNTNVGITFGPTGNNGAKINVPKVVPAGDEKLLERMTAKYAEQLSEIPIGGVLGLGAFPAHLLQIDMAAGVIRFSAPPEDWSGFGVGSEFGYREGPAGLFLTDDARTIEQPKVAISTVRYEGLAAAKTIETWKIGKPDARPLMAGAIDVGAFSAFRVIGPPGKGDDLPDLALGTQFISQCRLLINTTAKRLSLEPAGAPQPVADDQAALLALSSGNADGMEAYLKKYANSWLTPELGLELLKRRTGDRNATREQLAIAIGFYANGFNEDKKSTALLSYADALIRTNDPVRNDAIAVTLDLAVKYGGKDLNGAALHQINGRRGLIAMKKGDLKSARRYLLSASFGLPRDPQINIWLGSLYRKLNQPARAWSKYVDATLAQDPPAAAFKGLAELNDDVTFRANFGGGDAELLLEGRTLSFSPPVTRQSDQQPAVKLIEFFADTQAAPAIGPRLAFNGLREFFNGTPVAFIAYHLDEQLTNPLSAERAEAYSIKTPGTLLADGKLLGTKTGSANDAEALYDFYLPQLLQPNANAPVSVAASQLKLSATAQGRTVSTTLNYTPAHPVDPAADLRLRVLLCEQRVFVPYGKMPMQYAVARSQFTPPGGAKVSGEIRQLPLSLHVDKLAANFYLDPDRLERQASRIDTRELQIIAILEDAATRRVIDVAMITPTLQPASGQTSSQGSMP